MSIWKAAALTLALPAALVLPAWAEDAPRDPTAIFERFDLDGDGRITRAEIEALPGARFAQMDTDGDGIATREEILAHAGARIEIGIDRMLQRGDTDGDGALSLAEMNEMREGRGPGRRGGPDAIFDRFDADGDGAVTVDEFRTGVAEMRGPRLGRGMHGDRG